jgi:toxin-antitoxin system PIN domain toxin
MIRKYLLDLDVVIALAELEHAHHRKARNWFDTVGGDRWGICSLTEVDFLRVAANPVVRPVLESLELAKAVLQTWRACSGFIPWPMPSEKSWIDLTADFASRVLGYRQVTDAYLLGLAIKEKGVLVTFDKGIQYMAGVEFARNVLVLE